MNLLTIIKYVAGGAVLLLYGVAVLGAIFLFLGSLVEELVAWLRR